MSEKARNSQGTIHDLIHSIFCPLSFEMLFYLLLLNQFEFDGIAIVICVPRTIQSILIALKILMNCLTIFNEIGIFLLGHQKKPTSFFKRKRNTSNILIWHFFFLPFLSSLRAFLLINK